MNLGQLKKTTVISTKKQANNVKTNSRNAPMNTTFGVPLLWITG